VLSPSEIAERARFFSVKTYHSKDDAEYPYDHEVTIYDADKNKLERLTFFDLLVAARHLQQMFLF